MSFSDTAASYLAVQGDSVLGWFFSFLFFFNLFFGCCKLAFVRIICGFSLSSEVLKLLLKLLLKKGFSELSMEKKKVYSFPRQIF